MRFVIMLSCLLMVASAWAKDFKVGTVDMQKLFKAYPGTKAAEKKMEATFEKRKKDLMDSESDLKDLADSIQSSSSILSDKEKKTKKAEYEKKSKDLYDAESQYQNDLNAKQAEVLQGIYDELKGYIAPVAKTEGVDLVLKSDEPVYAGSAVDLTDDVLKTFPKTAASDKDDSDSNN